MELTVNGKTLSLDADPDMPLLWALRDVAGLTGALLFVVVLAPAALGMPAIAVNADCKTGGPGK